MKQRKRNLTSVGEKRIIAEFIKPYFNASDNAFGVGDDCAMFRIGDDVVLFSTDRVPADLTAFRLGFLSYRGMGDYLARLNLSDIAACGGHPIGLLLNLGLPGSLSYSAIREICRGFRSCARRHSVEVLGGDITQASELSISATSIGRTKRREVLMRRGARAGDSIFVSRPLGMTPSAFSVFSGRFRLGRTERARLVRQFTHMEPMVSLGRALVRSHMCSSCMDNTDGIGQSLRELSELSRVAFVVDPRKLVTPKLVAKVAKLTGHSEMELMFGAGADFSLVGTLRGEWTSERATRRLRHPVEIIGRIEGGKGVWLDSVKRTELRFAGWNYFMRT